MWGSGLWTPHYIQAPIRSHGPFFYHLAPSVSIRPEPSTLHFRFPALVLLESPMSTQGSWTQFCQALRVRPRERGPPRMAFSAVLWVVKKTVHIKMKPKPGTKFAKDVVRRIVNKEVSYHDLRAYINATGTGDTTASWPHLRSEKGPLFPSRPARSKF